MTGYIVRIVRDGRPINIDIVKLTDVELEQFVTSKITTRSVDAMKRSQKLAWNWVQCLVKWIRDNVEEEEDETFTTPTQEERVALESKEAEQPCVVDEEV